MPCFHPLRAATKLDGRVKIIGAMNHTTAGEGEIAIPCGQCQGCRIDKSKMWALRCYHESQLHQHNEFATFTYEDEPFGGTLVRHHFQNFMKRLRRARPKENIRYYMCGEYGGQLKRPHYHACLFGLELHDRELWKIQNGHRLYRSKELNELWGLGFALTGDITLESAAYVARYVMKKITGKAAKKTDDNGLTYYERMDENTGEIYTLEPEYSTMSLKPAIGKNWYEKYSLDCFPSDFLVDPKGHKHSMPRYYDKLKEIEDAGTYELIKNDRKQRYEKFADNNTPKRLRVREKVFEARFRNLERPLENNDE